MLAYLGAKLLSLRHLLDFTRAEACWHRTCFSVSNMKTVCRLLTVAAFLLGTASVSSANAIVNGSFEDVIGPGTVLVEAHGTWALYESIPGWTSPVDLIEVGLGGVYSVTGFDGQNVLELDANHNATVSQIVTTPGGTYDLSFLYANRASLSTATTMFDVLWNGSPVVTNLSTISNVMLLYTLQVVATGSDTLSFVGKGTDDSFGAIIDNVQLNTVPDGGMTSVLLGLGIVGLGFVRRIVG